MLFPVSQRTSNGAVGHLLISKIYGYCIYALAVFTKKIKPKPNTLVFDLGFTWRRLRDSLRKHCLLSRLARKQSFRRLFGRLVVAK